MCARAESNFTAQLLRSIRALHILHRNAQRHQVSRRGAPGVDFEGVLGWTPAVKFDTRGRRLVMTLSLSRVAQERYYGET